MINPIIPPTWLFWCDIYLEISDDDRNSQSNGDKTDMKSESSDEEGNGDEDGSNGDDQLMCRLFTLSFVNIYGNTEVSRLSDDGRQIKFGGRKHLPFVSFTLSHWCVFVKPSPHWSTGSGFDLALFRSLFSEYFCFFGLYGAICIFTIFLVTLLYLLVSTTWWDWHLICLTNRCPLLLLGLFGMCSRTQNDL